MYAMMLAQNDLARAAEEGPIEAKRVARAGRFLAASHSLQRRRFRIRRCPRLKQLHVSGRSRSANSVHLAGQALAEANPYVPLPVRVLNRVEGLKAKGQWDIYNQLLMRRRIHLASQDWDAERKHLFRVEQRLMDAPAVPSRTVVMDL
ncbi:MAG: hypothetical protein HC853_14665 [Anaerolineae bacterium]|nr:hypothetical protein [Anaerolineae bacterium]